MIKSFTVGKCYRLCDVPVGSLVRPARPFTSFSMTLDSTEVVVDDNDNTKWLNTTNYEDDTNRVFKDRLMKYNMKVILIKLPEESKSN